MSTPANFDGASPTIDPADTVMLLIDHQSGLLQMLKDMQVAAVRRNVATLAKVATLAELPVIATASVPQGPNGPWIPEIMQNAPHTRYVARRGEINAWDNPDFVKAVEATGRSTLIVAGILTSVCVAFPCLSAVQQGYRVFAVYDASGCHSKMALAATMARLTQAGVVPIDTSAVVAEVQHTWKRDDAAQWAEVFAAVSPNYRLLMESYMRAQQATMNNEPLDSEK